MTLEELPHTIGKEIANLNTKNFTSLKAKIVTTSQSRGSNNLNMLIK